MLRSLTPHQYTRCHSSSLILQTDYQSENEHEFYFSWTQIIFCYPPAIWLTEITTEIRLLNWKKFACCCCSTLLAIYVCALLTRDSFSMLHFSKSEHLIVVAGFHTLTSRPRSPLALFLLYLQWFLVTSISSGQRSAWVKEPPLFYLLSQPWLLSMWLECVDLLIYCM